MGDAGCPPFNCPWLIKTQQISVWFPSRSMSNVADVTYVSWRLCNLSSLCSARGPNLLNREFIRLRITGFS
jgi:hypothetical protein